MRLEQEYGSRIEDVVVERIFFSEDRRTGLVHLARLILNHKILPI